MILHLLKRSHFNASAFLVAFFYILPGPGQAQPGFTLITNTISEKSYEWQSPSWVWHAVTIDGQTFTYPDSSSGLLWSRPGEPLLPMASFSLDLNPGQTAVVALENPLYKIQQIAHPLCPAPTVNPLTGDQLYPKVLDYSRISEFQPDTVCFSTIGQAAERRMLQVTLLPVQYNHQSGTIRILQYAQLRIKFGPPAAALQRPTADTIGYTSFDPALKISLVAEGPYAITGDDLIAAGVGISIIQPSRLQLFNKGIEQSLLVEDGGDGKIDPKDKILFYGRFRHGASEFYDAYSDTNVYWLTWNGSEGFRYQDFVTTDPDTMIHSFYDTLHFEEDHYYYSGDSDSEIHNSEKVPGEGWVWALLNKGESRILNFSLPMVALAQDSMRFRIKLRGTTLDSHSPDHHLQLSINDKLVSDYWFNDRSEVLVDLSLPHQIFHPGSNTLKVDLLSDTPAERSQIYLDWFDIAFWRDAHVNDDQLHFSLSEGRTKSVLVTGFQDSSVYFWDLANRRVGKPSTAGRMWREMLTLQSGGLLDGDKAVLVRNGKEMSPGKRGHNLWLLDPQDGRLLEEKHYDTYAIKADADSLAAWIDRLPDKALVAVAIRDEGSVSMTARAHEALEKLGSALTRSVGNRDSWALLGRKGARPGTVPEVLKRRSEGIAVLDTIMIYPQGGSTFAAQLVLPHDSSHDLSIFSSLGTRKPVRMLVSAHAGLRRSDIGADYIIITHPLLEEQARRLATYRTTANSWRTRVVLIENIYDEFNDGLADPSAIKTFLRYARENWQKPAPQFVLFLGDASWDPKNHYALESSHELVPTYGNPVSDSWFACLDSADDMLPDIHIGRIPAKNGQEADAAINKILTFEATPAAEWKKNFLFISGGFDFLEQSQFSQQTRRLISDFVNREPVFGSATALHKTTGPTQEGEHRQKILESIDIGAAWVNFIGHAGSSTWELMFNNADIEALNNAPRFPFISSMTCHTGRFAEPKQDSFGEHFLLAEDKGAIGFMGTSGWGYTYEDYAFLRKLFPVALQDSLRYLSGIINSAKIMLWKEAATNLQIRDMMYQYNLLGDPAIKLPLPLAPDLALQASDIQIWPERPSVSDSLAMIHCTIHNYGLLSADSVLVRVTAAQEGSGEHSIVAQKRLAPVGLSDSLLVPWPLRGLAGAAEIAVYVDPENRIREADETNNMANRSVTITSDRLMLVTPKPFTLWPSSEVLFRVTQITLGYKDLQNIEISLDTTLTFSSPLLQRSGSMAFDGLTLTWRPISLRQGVTYYWRCVDSDAGTLTVLQSGEITVGASTHTGWRQQNNFTSTIVAGIDMVPDVRLGTVERQITAASGGLHDGNYAGIYINGDNIITQGRGYNLAIVNPVTGQVEQTRKFDVYGNSAMVTDMAEYMNHILPGRIVVMAVQDDGYFTSPDLIQAFESIGSSACRNIGFRDSWALIGIKGTPPGSAREVLQKSGAGDAAVRDTLNYLAPSGTITSPRIGPAAAWRSLSAEAEIPANCSVTLDLLGQRRGSTVWDTLRTGLPANREVDISTISAYTWPFLQLRATLSSADQLETPRLTAWQVLHDPVPDLAVTPAFLKLSADSVLSGEAVILKFDLFNIGLAAADSISVTCSETAPGSPEKIFARLRLPQPLAADQQLAVDQLYTPTGRPGSRLLTIRVDGENRINELSESNNTITTRLEVVADTLAPEIELLCDGRRMASGDWVSATPLIQARILDNSPLPMADTLAVNLFLDMVRIPFSGPQGAELLPASDGQARGLVQFRPQLAEGDHSFEVIYTDASGNRSSAGVDLRVASSLKLLRVMNYPNPFQESTDFTFELTQAADVRIRIYTVAGRLIRTLEAGTLGAGFSRVYWDGRDGDGDLPANGVYLYRVDATAEEEHSQVVEKCIIAR